MAPPDTDTSAKRAMAAPAPDDKTGGSTFDGTGDYQSWRRAQQVEAFMHDSGVAAAKVVFRRLRGAAIDTALAAVQVNNLAGFPFQTVAEILIALDLGYGGTLAYTKVEAVRQLMRLRQGTRSFEDYVQQFQSLAAKSQLDNASLIAALQAGVSGKLAPTAAMIEEDTILGTAIGRLKKVDLMTPNTTFPKRDNGGNKSFKGRASSTDDKPKRDLSAVTCYNCDKKGHLARDCRGPKRARKGKTTEARDDNPVDDDIVEHAYMSGNE